MNRIVLDQMTRALNKGRLNNRDHFEDQAMAIGAMEYMIQKLESYLNECLNVENGQCSTLYRHESCSTLMMILYDLTNDEKYKISY